MTVICLLRVDLGELRITTGVGIGLAHLLLSARVETALTPI